MDRSAGDDVSQSEGTTTHAKKPSLDEAVKSAVQSLQDSGNQPVPNADADDEDADDEAEDGTQAADATGDGGEAGSDKDGDAKDADDAETPAKSDESDSDGAEQDASEAASSTLEAPAKWPQDRKEEFSKLPDEAKKIVLAREAEYNKGFTEYAQKVQGEVKLAKDVQESFTDNHREQMRASGLDEAGAVRELVKLHDHYRSDPVAYVRSAIKHQQLTPEQVFPEYFADEPQDQGQGQANGQSAPDPALQNVQQQVGSIQQFLSEQVKRQQLSVFQETINRLADEKDESGNAKRPYFEDVVDDMIDMVGKDAQAGKLQSGSLDEYLAQAYEAAVYRRPDLREKIVESEVESRLAKSQQHDEADKARRASTRKGSPGASTGKARKSKMTLDEAVETAVKSGGAA